MFAERKGAFDTLIQQHHHQHHHQHHQHNGYNNAMSNTRNPHHHLIIASVMKDQEIKREEAALSTQGAFDTS